MNTYRQLDVNPTRYGHLLFLRGQARRVSTEAQVGGSRTPA